MTLEPIQESEETQNFTIKISLADREEFKRLDVYLTTKLPQFSRSTIKRLFEDEEITSDIFDRCHAEKSLLQQLSAEITAELDAHKYHIVSEKLYHYVWDAFASDFIEFAKTALKNPETTPQEKWLIQDTLRKILIQCITMLHPFMPFITEEIWSLVPAELKTSGSSSDLLMIETWPA